MTKVKENPSLSRYDFNSLAEYMHEELTRRKGARRYLEGQWSEIARQKAMKPSPPAIDIESGKTRRDLGWMPYLEMPWQIETLEIGCADAMRLIFPPDQKFFSAKPDVGDKQYAEVIESAAKTEGFLVSDVDEGDMSAIIEAALLANQKFYGLRRQIGLTIADVLSYGTGAGRGRPGKIATQNPNFTGMPYAEGSTLPMFTNMSIWNTFLDDRYPAAMQQDFLTAPATIYEFTVNYAALMLAAKDGSSNPEDPDGGWIKSAFDDLKADVNGHVTMIELEGDIQIQDNDNEWIFLSNACATAVVAQAGSTAVCKIIRFRQSDSDYRKVLSQPYFQDTMHPRRVSAMDGSDLWGYQERGVGHARAQTDSDFSSGMGVYGSGPLMFGLNLQKAGSDAFSRSIQAGILNVLPVIKGDKNDPFFRGDDFAIYPMAKWLCLGDVETIPIGDQNALGGWFNQMKGEHANVTGTDAPRLGQQTKSHQTAYAVDTELQRGSVRVVDFIQDMKTDFLPSWLQIEYAMLRRHLPKKGVRVWVPKYKGFMTITSKMLPENVSFDVHGAAQPLEDRQKKAERMEKISALAEVDQYAVQAGQQPMNWAEIRRAIIEDDDIDPAKLTPETSGVDAGVESLSPSIAGEPGIPEASAPVTSLSDIRLASGASGPTGE